ncbi:MAG: hypothetical protein AAB706_00855 [Patescibacteria group bacterium]
MKNNVILVAVILALILSGVSFFRSDGNPPFGAAGGMLAENYWPYLLYNDGYKSENEIVLSGADGDITTGDDLTVTDDTTLSGGVVTVTTTNTATSSMTLGCIQTYATSTATAVRFVLSSAGTTTATFGAGTASGGVSWQYGTCPI